jgi:DNA-binding LytR/AlgR family response regulator
MSNAVPMTMIINIPEQVLLIKVSRLGNEHNETTGFVLVFYDVTQVVSQADAGLDLAPPNMRLSRIPMVANQKVSFVDTQDVLCLESQAHYTRVLTAEGFHFCNLSIGDLELRLDPAQFQRVHRRFIVNLKAVQELGREGTKTHLVLKGKKNQPIPVSRTAVSRLRESLGLS